MPSVVIFFQSGCAQSELDLCSLVESIFLTSSGIPFGAKTVGGGGG